MSQILDDGDLGFISVAGFGHGLAPGWQRCDKRSMRVLTFALVLIFALPALAEGDIDEGSDNEAAETEAETGETENTGSPLFGRRVADEAAEEASDDEADEEDTSSDGEPDSEWSQNPTVVPATPIAEPGAGDDSAPIDPDEAIADDEVDPGESASEPERSEDSTTEEDAEDQEETVEEGADEGAPDESAEEVDEILNEIQEGLDSAEEAVRQAAEEAAAPIEIPPPNLSEPPSIPRRSPPPPVPGVDEDEGWRPELSAATGLFIHEGTDVGFHIGAGFALVEHGPQTRPEYMLGSGYARRDVWGILHLDLGFEPNVGLDETEVAFSIKGVRTQVTTPDESESGISEIRFAPIRYQRALSMDRELDLTVSVVEGYADRRFAVREGTGVRVIAAVEALGYEHIRYTPLRSVDHFFNGVRALSLDLAIAPEFSLGEGGSQFRYIAGFAADIALGSRDGGLLVVHSDMSAESGLGGDITEWVTWSGVIGYRGAVDSRRPNRSGWYSTIRVTGRLP